MTKPRTYFRVGAPLPALLVLGCTAADSPLTSEVVEVPRDLKILASLRWTRDWPAPESPSNRYAHDPQAVALGRRLFFEPRLSASGTIACSSCHEPERAFTDGRTVAKGAGRGARNTPSLLAAPFFEWWYWDGRRDSLWSQALVPIEAGAEMASSRVAAVRLVALDLPLRTAYEAVFEPLPARSWLERLPGHASPFGAPEVRSAWFRLPSATQKTVNRIYSNIGKAIEAFERTLRPAPTRLDGYIEAKLKGDEALAQRLLTPEERRGLDLFISERARCLRCHSGPLLTNGGFHNLDTGRFEGDALDFGRSLGMRAVRLDEFNCLGPYSDARPEACRSLRFMAEETPEMTGAFKVPSLRAVGRTAPYFHDGRFSTLEEVVRFYSAATRQDGQLVPASGFTEDEVRDLIAFLEAL